MFCGGDRARRPRRAETKRRDAMRYGSVCSGMESQPACHPSLMHWGLTPGAPPFFHFTPLPRFSRSPRLFPPPSLPSPSPPPAPPQSVKIPGSVIDLAHGLDAVYSHEDISCTGTPGAKTPPHKAPGTRQQPPSPPPRARPSECLVRKPRISSRPQTKIFSPLATSTPGLNLRISFHPYFTGMK